MDNMKKWIAIPAMAGAVVLGGVAMVANADKNETEAKSAGFLTVEEVETKAVKTVGGHVTEIDLKNQKDKYEVEVKNEGTEYELYIDATTGDIIHKEQENSLAVAKTDSNKNKSKEKSKYLTAEEAIAIAMKTAQGTVTELEFDDDDGRKHYEIEIEDGVYEYEFEIDAITGEVLDFEKDHDDD